MTPPSRKTSDSKNVVYPTEDATEHMQEAGKWAGWGSGDTMSSTSSPQAVLAPLSVHVGTGEQAGHVTSLEDGRVLRVMSPSFLY